MIKNKDIIATFERDKYTSKRVFLISFLNSHGALERYEELTDIHHIPTKAEKKELEKVNLFLEKNKVYIDEDTALDKAQAYRDFSGWMKSKEHHKGFQYISKTNVLEDGKLKEKVLGSSLIGFGKINFMNVVSSLTNGIAFQDYNGGSCIYYADVALYYNYNDILNFKALKYNRLTVKVKKLSLLYFRDSDKDYITYGDCFYEVQSDYHIPGNADVGNYRKAKETTTYRIEMPELGVSCYCVYPQMVYEFCIYLKRLGANIIGDVPQYPPMIYLNTVRLPDTNLRAPSHQE